MATKLSKEQVFQAAYDETANELELVSSGESESSSGTKLSAEQVIQAVFDEAAQALTVVMA